MPFGAAPAQTPEAETELPFSPWRVTDSREIDVDGQPIALSPDGRWIAGIGPDGGSICVWDVTGVRTRCAGEGLDIQTHPIDGGFAWAPDSSAVAFINGNWRQLEPTDVLVFDIRSGWLRNLTHTTMTGRRLVHTGPAWTADSSRVVYAQTDPSAGDDAQPASIFTWYREYSTNLPVPLKDAFYIYAP